MGRVLYSIFADYGLDAVQLGVICWFAWKLLTNHFAHLTKDLQELKEGQNKINTKLDNHSERISLVEGKLS